HRANRCLDCHTDIVFHKGHSQVPKIYGGWANFSAEDTILTRNYTTQASVACVNCHTEQLGFLTSQHYLIGDIKNSHKEFKNGTEIGKDYNKAQCGKCHLTCATCHFKAVRIRTVYGIGGEDDVWDIWGYLLRGERLEQADKMTNWAIIWTSNVEAHDFSTGDELRSSNDLCRICHTGFYTNYNQKGYYHPDGFQYWDSLVSQGVEKYPQYEEWRFLKGDINVDVMTVFPSLDSLYDRVENDRHSRYKCLDCHDRVHSLAPITCYRCHSDKKIPRNKPHEDVACVACHDATMDSWRDPSSGDTVRVAAVKDNKVINWHSHMLINPEEETNFCKRKCHNPETGPRIGARWTKDYTGNIHD
ncbi:MAG: hypothetical protein V1890_02535, partial [Candidatus Zixiibacteriota bacterium]